MRHAVRRSEPEEQASDEIEAAAILTIDLRALADNYRHLCKLVGPAECAGVVKADAYGLGMAEVAPALSRAGCRSFFVATVGEGKTLRELLPDATIYVFDGLFPGAAPLLAEHALQPVLNSLDEVKEWAAFCRASGKRLPAALHLDSGMNRLGLSGDEVDGLARESSLVEAFALTLVMSHLACADDARHAKNEAQRSCFEERRKKLPPAPASLANSAGVLLGERYHYDLVRPGIALYGGHPQRRGENPFQAVVGLSGRIAQIRHVSAGETIGYGASRTLRRASRIATVSIGYADGLFRSLSAPDGEEGLSVTLDGHPAPILGRVSMDLITVDVTDIPEALARRGAFVELLGPDTPASALAAKAGTIDYEVLTNLGRRALRRYVG